ncbi:hypothetical protein BC567DRAFT_231512, partial [Phyllosticta citribraziliensis]
MVALPCLLHQSSPPPTTPTAPPGPTPTATPPLFPPLRGLQSSSQSLWSTSTSTSTPTFARPQLSPPRWPQWRRVKALASTSRRSKSRRSRSWSRSRMTRLLLLRLFLQRRLSFLSSQKHWRRLSLSSPLQRITSRFLSLLSLPLSFPSSWWSSLPLSMMRLPSESP